MKKVHLTTIEHRHGVDIICTRNKPTQDQLKEIENKFKQDNGIDENEDVFVDYYDELSTELTVNQYLTRLK